MTKVMKAFFTLVAVLFFSGCIETEKSVNEKIANSTKDVKSEVTSKVNEMHGKIENIGNDINKKIAVKIDSMNTKLKDLEQKSLKKIDDNTKQEFDKALAKYLSAHLNEAVNSEVQMQMSETLDGTIDVLNTSVINQFEQEKANLYKIQELEVKKQDKSIKEQFSSNKNSLLLFAIIAIIANLIIVIAVLVKKSNKIEQIMQDNVREFDNIKRTINTELSNKKNEIHNELVNTKSTIDTNLSNAKSTINNELSNTKKSVTESLTKTTQDINSATDNKLKENVQKIHSMQQKTILDAKNAAIDGTDDEMLKRIKEKAVIDINDILRKIHDLAIENFNKEASKNFEEFKLESNQKINSAIGNFNSDVFSKYKQTMSQKFEQQKQNSKQEISNQMYELAKNLEEAIGDHLLKWEESVEAYLVNIQSNKTGVGNAISGIAKSINWSKVGNFVGDLTKSVVMDAAGKYVDKKLAEQQKYISYNEED
jgi:hypothetical protein